MQIYKITFLSKLSKEFPNHVFWSEWLSYPNDGMRTNYAWSEFGCIIRFGNEFELWTWLYYSNLRYHVILSHLSQQLDIVIGYCSINHHPASIMGLIQTFIDAKWTFLEREAIFVAVGFMINPIHCDFIISLLPNELSCILYEMGFTWEWFSSKNYAYMWRICCLYE
jgi:hypothetical protein